MKKEEARRLGVGWSDWLDCGDTTTKRTIANKLTDEKAGE